MIFWYIGRFHPFPSISAPLLSPAKSPHKRKKDPRLFALSLFYPIFCGGIGTFFAWGKHRDSDKLFLCLHCTILNAERQEHLFPNHQKSLKSNSGYRCFNSFHFSRNVSVVKYLPVIWSLPFTSSITVSPDLVFIFPAQQYKDQPLCCKYPWKSQSNPDLVWSCQKRCCYPKSSGRWSRRNPESCEDPDFSIQEPDL